MSSLQTAIADDKNRYCFGVQGGIQAMDAFK